MVIRKNPHPPASPFFNWGGRGSFKCHAVAHWTGMKLLVSIAKLFSPFCKLQTIHERNVHSALPLSTADIPCVHFLLQFQYYIGANSEELPYVYWDLFSFLERDSFGDASRGLGIFCCCCLLAIFFPPSFRSAFVFWLLSPWSRKLCNAFLRWPLVVRTTIRLRVKSHVVIGG